MFEVRMCAFWSETPKININESIETYLLLSLGSIHSLKCVLETRMNIILVLVLSACQWAFIQPSFFFPQTDDKQVFPTYF